MASPQVVNLEQVFGRVDKPWNPTIVGEINDTYVKIVKLEGEFLWHHHDVEDELFLVVRGRMRMRLEDGDKDVGPGEFIVIPHGVEHCPVAVEAETQVVLLEPKSTLNTGNVRNERTRPELERLT